MRHVVWGPRNYQGLPDVGDYIRVRVIHKFSGVFDTQVGFVASITDGFVCFLGDPPEYGHDWSAIWWQRGKVPEFNQKIKARKELA